MELSEESPPKGETTRGEIDSGGTQLVSFALQDWKSISQVYSNDEEYFADIAKAYRDELKILYDNGLRNVQIDDPNLACLFFL
jgi:hypothetical protein